MVNIGHTLFFRFRLAPPFTSSTTTSVRPCLVASIRAESPSCTESENVNNKGNEDYVFVSCYNMGHRNQCILSIMLLVKKHRKLKRF